MNSVKSSRAPLNALIVVANTNTSHRAFHNLAIPGVETHVSHQSDFRREISRIQADVLVVESTIPAVADVIAHARSLFPSLPILFLTQQLDDVAAAVAAGANDFATSTATASELGIRIQLLASAVARPLPQLRPIGPLSLDREARLLSHRSKSVGLSPIEAKMFERLLLEVGRPVSRAELERSIWGQIDVAERLTNVAVVYVSYLRKKLARLGDVCTIRTITNVGYALEIREPEGKPARPRTRR
jgi:DNA-binding response OmpR family regulator